ncbi:LamG domain-containing protein [Actinophytocola sediminis]
MAQDGKSVAVYWPGVLPEPRMDGAVVTYPGVLSGVDLVMRVEPNGYSQHLVVRTAEAARNPALARLAFRIEAVGLRVRADEDGALTAADFSGAPVFEAAVSVMWDSSGPTPSNPATARSAPVGVTVEKGSLVLRPDLRFLADPAVVYPVTIDPKLLTVSRTNWATVLSGNRSTPYWWTSGSPPWAQVGQCYTASRECNGIGEARTYYQFNTSSIAGKNIINTEFRAEVVHSPNCSAQNHELYVVSGAQVNGSTTWDNMPPGGLLKVSSVQGVWDSCPGRKPVGFAFPAGHEADGIGAVTTYFVKAQDTGNQAAWRKYDPTKTKLSVTYNTAPSTPELVATDPPTTSACRWCGGVPYVGDSSIRLLTRLRDPDGDKLRAKWRTKIDGVETAWDGSALQSSGATHDATVNLTDKHGKTVQWWVHGFDGVDLSPHGWAKTFAVDRQPPTQLPDVSSVEYPDDNRWHGGVGVAGTFTFTANGATDIDHYLYGWSAEPSTRIDAVGRLSGDASMRLEPPGDGPRTLYVRSVDRAGHRGPTVEYRIYVRAGNGALSQWSFEGNADDTAFLGDRHGTVHGSSTYVPGAEGNAIQLTDGDHMTAPNTVDPRGSFSVSAWVQVDDPMGTHTAVSQDGVNSGAFQLGYRAEGAGAGWYFVLPRADGNSPVMDEVRVPGTALPNTWTHLAGVYDAKTDTATLYVNGTGLGVSHSSTWQSTGVVRIGGALVGGTVGNHWRGLVDEVRMYDRVLSQTEVEAAVSASDVKVADWQFEEETGRTVRNSVEGGPMAVLTEEGASFEEDEESGNGVLRLDGGYAETDGPLVRTDQSFSMVARVSMDEVSDGTYTVLSQDGANTCGFCLSYEQASGSRQWAFTMPRSDVDNPDSYDTVRMPMTQAEEGSTHLAAVYNAPTGELRLFVDGVAASSTPPPRTRWHAAGKFALGRTLDSGHDAQLLRGWIDEARVYSRAISQDEVRGLLAADGVTAGSWELDGNANDATDPERNGVLHGTPEWAAGQTSSPAPGDLAVRLNGDNQYISVGRPVVATNVSFSVTAWARLDELGGTAMVVSQDGTNRSGFSLGALPDGRWAFTAPKADTASAGADRAVSLAAATQVGVWTHLAGVYSQDRRTLELYVNGSPAGSASHTEVATAGALAIGRAKLTATQHGDYFPGAIDDVNVYSRTLFASEVHTLAGRDLSLVHHWQLDENAGRAAADAVGGRGGTLQGGASFEPSWVGNGVSLNGTDAAISTNGVDLQTDKSFTVGAWVRFNPTECDLPAVLQCMSTAVSADGDETSKFRLGHVADTQFGRRGKWVFEMPTADAGDGVQLEQAALSVTDAEVDRWVHLVGVYDAPMKKIWLYVNGNRVDDGTLESAWSATGGLQIGRGKVSGEPGQYWPGGVDDVRLYAGVQDRDRVTSWVGSYPSAPPAPEAPQPDAGYWTFDEGTGSSAVDVEGHRHLTLYGGAGWLPARSAWGGAFDGVDAYAETVGPVVDTSGSFSISAWASASTSSGLGTVLGQDGDEVSAFVVQYRPSDSRWVVRVPTGDGVVTLVSTEAATTSQQTHLTVTYDAEQDGRLRLYVNGSVSAVRLGVQVPASAGPFSVGRSLVDGQHAEFLNGRVDDIRAFSRVLTDGEIRKVYDDVYLSVQGNWRFDGAAIDDSFRQNPTTLSGSPSYVSGVNGQALRLNGTTQAATTQRFGVSMTASFTASAWVRLTATDRVQTVLGQDGTRTSGYVLQYRPELNRWVFGAPTQDADGAALVSATSSLPPTPRMWTHLTGVYDYPTRQLRLYVDGVLTGSRNNVLLWPASGGLTVGRGKTDGQPAQFLAGDVDEVTIDLGAAAESEILRRASFPAPPAGQLGRFANGRGDHYTASTDLPAPAGYHLVASLGGLAPADGLNTRVLYACQVGTDVFTSANPNCEGQTVLGEAGRVYDTPPESPQTVPLYRCNNGADHFESLDPLCGNNGTQEAQLGYTVGYAPFARYNTPQGWDHASTVHGVPPGYRTVAAQGLTSLVAVPGGHELFNCRDGMDLFVSDDAACEGKTVVSSIGWAWAEPPDRVPSVPIHRCEADSQSFVAWSEECEGQTVDRALGYLVTVVPGLEPVEEPAVRPDTPDTETPEVESRAGTRPPFVVGWVI